MNNSALYIDLAKLIFLFVANIILIGMAGMQLRRKHASDIRVIFYFFALALVLTTVVGVFAVYAGGIDSKGNFSGAIGAAISWGLNETLALDHSVTLFAVIALCIVLPQLIAYILSGLFGVALGPVFMQASIDLVVFSIVKSATVASGVVLASSILGKYFGWSGWSWIGMLAMQSFSMILMTLSFGTAWYYRQAKELDLSAVLSKYFVAESLFSAFHRLMTRYKAVEK